MSGLRTAELWEIWGFVRGDVTAADFLSWVYAHPESEDAFGATLYFDLISANPRDKHSTYDLRERLYDWALKSPSQGCTPIDFLRRYRVALAEMVGIDRDFWSALDASTALSETTPDPHSWDLIELGDGWRRPLLLIGFWRSPEQPHLPHPKDSVDLEWDRAERDRVAIYLENAHVARGCLGFSWCRMGCPGIPPDIGTRDLTDGTWLFPEGFAHYVVHHSVKPDPAFMEHVRRNDYRIPILPLPRMGTPRPL